jgi:hypothetical protein
MPPGTPDHVCDFINSHSTDYGLLGSRPLGTALLYQSLPSLSKDSTEAMAECYLPKSIITCLAGEMRLTGALP